MVGIFPDLALGLPTALQGRTMHKSYQITSIRKYAGERLGQADSTCRSSRTPPPVLVSPPFKNSVDNAPSQAPKSLERAIH
jgi:hypothetical protein